MKIAAMVAIYLIGTAQLFPLYAKGAEDRVVAQVRLGESDSYEYKNLLLGTNSEQSAYWIAGQRARLECASADTKRVPLANQLRRKTAGNRYSQEFA